MLILNSPEVTQETCLRWKKAGSIALVPTMGCLHEGHLELVRKAKALASKVIVSIFVNPLQFGPNEDFDKYPRSFDEDCQKLESLGVDLLLHPSVNELYPQEFACKLSVGEIGNRLCGKFRPNHFDGVATIVLKLFEISACDIAVFGEKDFQQLTIIEQLVRDFNLPIRIVPVATVRDADHVALSSRNNYLSNEERQWAGTIPETLSWAKETAKTQPQLTVGELLERAQAHLLRTPLKIQYIELTQGKALHPIPPQTQLKSLTLPHLFIAVYAGSTRLIDNVSLES